MSATGSLPAKGNSAAGAQVSAAATTERGKADKESSEERNRNIGEAITLGALGTALLPTARPRALLIDEIDKSDVDLPNDLLNVFEEGEFEIPELRRLGSDAEVEVFTSDPAQKRAWITGGVVACKQFPLMILTSNGERGLPAPFLRRCLRLRMPNPAGQVPEDATPSTAPAAREQARNEIAALRSNK